MSRLVLTRISITIRCIILSDAGSNEYTIITSTITANGSGGIYYIPHFEPRILNYISTTVTEATIFTVTATGYPESTILTFPVTSTSVLTYTLDNGPLTFMALDWNNFTEVRLNGPTTATLTASAPGDWLFRQGAGRGLEVSMFKAAYTSGCDEVISQIYTADMSSYVNAHVVKRKSAIATLTAGETSAVMVPEYTNYTTRTAEQIFTGPTTVFYTTSNSLMGRWFTDGHMGPVPPGYRCSGKCFECKLFFFTVSVYYWPEKSPNTACLSTASSTTKGNSVSIPGMKVEARSLTGMAVDATTFITSGFIL